MEGSGNKLIEELVAKHQPRPWWKNPVLLFTLWFVSHFVYFAGLAFLKSDLILLRSSYVYFGFISVGILLSGAVFIGFSRTLDLRVSNVQVSIAGLIALMGSAFFIESYFLGTVLHGRELSVTFGDFTCFWHSVISMIAPILFFPVIYKHFFVPHSKLSMIFMGIHLALLGSLITELKCPDREMWHLLLGHQTTFFGVILFMMSATYFYRRLSFSRV